MKKILLYLLNKFNNGTPSEYALVNNVENFSRDFLDSVDDQWTMRKFLDWSDKFSACCNGKEGAVIIGDVVYKGDDILLDELTPKQ